MNIEMLYEMQKELDERIIREKGLEGQDLLPNTVLALQVELGELANEWRGFKHWSNDRVPRIAVGVKCTTCKGNGEIPDLANGFGFTNCPDCGRSGVVVVNRLLEEYVDCLHFFLSIAVKNGWKDDLHVWSEAIEEVQEKGLDGGVNGAFLEIVYWLMKMHMENDSERFRGISDTLGITQKQFCFRNAWFVFVCLGVVGFGFTWEQITAAYVAKNRVNHERQENGY